MSTNSELYWPCEHGLSLLVVEDDPVDAGLLERQLCAINHAFDVRSVACGQEALLAHGSMTADCVLLDYHLPTGNADEFLMDLIALDHSAPVIIVTGAEDVSVVSRTLAIGASDVLFKHSVTLELLRDSINKAVLRAGHRRDLIVGAMADVAGR